MCVCVCMCMRVRVRVRVFDQEALRQQREFSTSHSPARTAPSGSGPGASAAAAAANPMANMMQMYQKAAGYGAQSQASCKRASFCLSQCVLKVQLYTGSGAEGASLQVVFRLWGCVFGILDGLLLMILLLVVLCYCCYRF